MKALTLVRRGFWTCYLSVCLCASLPGDFHELTVDSGEAEYDGRSILLTGNVVVEHMMGKLSSENMQVLSENEGKKKRFNLIKMQNNVLVELREGGQLISDLAELDYDSLTGNFFSNTCDSYVIYSDNTRSPMQIKSHLMSIRLGQEQNRENSQKIVLSSLKAVNDVSIEYSGYLIKGAIARYERMREMNSKTKAPGKIVLQGEEESKCQITNSKEDYILANQVEIDTVKQQFFFSEPEGYLSGPAIGGISEKISFSSREMVWDEASDQLILKENVVIHQKGIGDLTSDQEVTIKRDKKKGDLTSVECQGKTVITHLDELKDLQHTITSYGKVFVDHQSKQTVINTPFDKQGIPDERLQVVYEDHIGKIRANKMTLDYQLLNGVLVPSKLLLEGNVYLINRIGSMEEEDKGQQYALADKLTYDFATKQMELKAKKKGRVLFFDKINNLQMSAPRLVVKRDSRTSKDSIKGYGDVRFHFIDNEFEQIRKHFQFKP